jgi:hypothetical protein
MTLQNGTNQMRFFFGTDGATSNLIQLLINFGSWPSNFKVVSSSAVTLSSGVWFHVMAIIDMVTLSNSKVYVNGVSRTVSTATNGSPSAFIPTVDRTVGLFAMATRTFHGTQDETRFSNVARSSDYAATNYNAQNAPTSFTIAGTPTPTGASSAPFLFIVT